MVCLVLHLQLDSYSEAQAQIQSILAITGETEIKLACKSVLHLSWGTEKILVYLDNLLPELGK